jgi:hypothetical protein
MHNINHIDTFKQHDRPFFDIFGTPSQKLPWDIFFGIFWQRAIFIQPSDSRHYGYIHQPAAALAIPS